ncbi:MULTISPECIES: DUF456 domain-containing protein [unclassified Arthrobacter]|uniref:DUF456 domain-containing protein n=1 Tax=unclassified Arthrobacter TaxID=235627 RepID=UPI001492EBE8|nr:MULTISPECIES: DUF456 domain-containing protein [unclassified Arthrobacter]MBE0010572.1 DUF456 domain-containing protein [Arthrobacter sp. AET 35A]NOJ58789.1 DUF456 domain-containing protein [Arthrobacter sp. 260]NOJ64413.1 DUF456 domain-containing protein [Arthrobacter sp. 147(2020)]
MEFQILMTVLSGLLIVVGVAGVIVPILPGSILIIGSLLMWALVVSSTAGWVAFGVGAVLAVAGLLAGAVLTGRKLQQRQIPGRSVVVGLVTGVIGMFLIPVVGLFVGFAAGLFASEFARQRQFAPALSSSGAALKATGIGILVELGLALLAGSVWVIGVWVHFATV